MFRKAMTVGALALALVPAAQAQPRQVIPYMSHGIGVDKSLYTGERSFPRPDDRAGIRGVGSDVTAVQATSTSSFDWTQFLVGAGLALALIALVAAGVASSKRHGKALQTD